MGFALAALFGVIGRADDTDARQDRLAAVVTEAMKRNEVPGASIAVVDGFRVAWAQGFGVLTAGGSDAVTPTTRFQAASISKPVSALAALRTVELGKLTLDDDVNRRLTSWHIPDSPLLIGRPITLRMLLSHSAGLSVHGFAGYSTDAALPTLVQVLSGSPPANSPPVKLLMKPGYKFSYSGGGYSVVQQLLIDVTGKPFAEYMHEQVLEPLGMIHSTYEQPLPAELASVAASGHRDGQPIAGRWHVYPEMAAAGLWTTPSDLALVVIEVGGTYASRGGKLLSPGMIAEMLTPQSGSVVTYGLGFSVRGEGRAFTFSHGGSNEGFRCQLVGVPATGQGVIIMTNSESGSKLLQAVLPVVSEAYGWPVGE